MKSLRVSLVLAGMLMLSASTLSAQGTRISCKDGSKPKVGHFSCWGHGGLVREAASSAPKADKPKAEKAAKKPASPSTVKKTKGKKTPSTAAKTTKKSKKKHKKTTSKSSTT